MKDKIYLYTRDFGDEGPHLIGVITKADDAYTFEYDPDAHKHWYCTIQPLKDLTRVYGTKETRSLFYRVIPLPDDSGMVEKFRKDLGLEVWDEWDALHALIKRASTNNGLPDRTANVFWRASPCGS